MAKCRVADQVECPAAECLRADLLQAVCQADRWAAKRANIKH